MDHIKVPPYQSNSKSRFDWRANRRYGAYIKSYILDRNGNNETIFAIAGLEDKDANSATTLLITPGFKGVEHPRECLSFWYKIKV